jgi:hypothetical protein
MKIKNYTQILPKQVLKMKIILKLTPLLLFLEVSVFKFHCKVEENENIQQTFSHHVVNTMVRGTLSVCFLVDVGQVT